VEKHTGKQSLGKWGLDKPKKVVAILQLKEVLKSKPELAHAETAYHWLRFRAKRTYRT
jgi:hypothetical protein